MSKYGNKKTVVDGITFDSMKEANRWIELMLMERAGLIKNILRQQKFELLPSLVDEKGKLIQRPVFYIADFCYSEKTSNGWKRVVEDVKSEATKTAVYKLKKKLFRWKYGIEIKEV